MNIFVTGGSGFIGTNFIKLALTEGHKIFNIDNLKLFKEDGNIKHKNYFFKKVDIFETNKIIKFLIDFNPDRLINFAAETHVDESILYSDLFIKTNVLGTLSLLQASLEFIKRKKSSKKFIFHQISTDEVFGSLNIDENKKKFDEDSIYKPSSPYSASKASADHLVKAWCKTYNLNYNITYSSNNYGPFQHPSKFIPTVIISNILKTKIPIYGNGMNVRDWIFVKDHAMALLELIKFNKENVSYVIGGNNEFNNLKTANLICNYFNLNHKNQFDHNSLINFVEDRKGHDERYSVNTKKIQTDLNWKAKTDFGFGLSKTIKWFELNNIWWKNYHKK